VVESYANIVAIMGDREAIDAHDNICFWTRDRIATEGGKVWESPYFWEAWHHIEEVTPLPDGLVWIRGRHLYAGSEYTREEWEAKEPSYQYLVARQSWLAECRRTPVHSKVWSFDEDDVQFNSLYPFASAQLALFD
jgi:hypothetical protein